MYSGFLVVWWCLFGFLFPHFFLFYYFFFIFPPSTASSAVSAVKMLRTAIAAHVQHQNVCLVVTRHACSGCASLFCSVKVSMYMTGCNLSLSWGSGDEINISNLCFGNAGIVYIDLWFWIRFFLELHVFCRIETTAWKGCCLGWHWAAAVP